MPVARRLWDSCVVIGYLAGYEDLKPECPLIIEQAERGEIQIVVSAMATIEVAYLAWECGFDELIFWQYPQQPFKLTEYKNLRLDERRKGSEKFWRSNELIEYRKEYNKIEDHNCGTCWWLGELIKRFDKVKDKMRADVCKERLNKFPDNLLGRYK